MTTIDKSSIVPEANADKTAFWPDDTAPASASASEVTPSGWPLIFIFLAVLLLWALNWIIGIAYTNDAAWRSNVAGMFGFASSLFSGLAFAGIIWTIWLQREELRLQRAELVLTRNELEKAASAQNKSQLALTEQVRALIEQRRLSVLPYFIASPGRRRILLTNVGQGPARNITFGLLRFPIEGLGDYEVAVSCLQGGQVALHGSEVVTACHGIAVQESCADDDVWAMLALLVDTKEETQTLLDCDFDLTVQFEDIEGRQYDQVISFMGTNTMPQLVSERRVAQR